MSPRAYAVQHLPSHRWLAVQTGVVGCGREMKDVVCIRGAHLEREDTNPVAGFCHKVTGPPASTTEHIFD